MSSTTLRSVAAAIGRGKDVLEKQVQLDADGLKADIDAL